MQLKWSLKTPRVLISAASSQFDPVAISHWREEGFTVSYLAFDGSQKQYAASLRAIAEPLGFGEEFALIAYGDAAAAALEACTQPLNKLNALVCYYPPSFPPPGAGFPPSLKVLLHLAMDSQSPPTTFPTFTYPHALRGFAETDSSQYEKISTNLAWSRTLGAVRKGFSIELDLESVWENHLALEFSEKGIDVDPCIVLSADSNRDADATMKTMVDEPYVNHIPTMAGGIGFKDLHRFYKDYFIQGNPPSMNMRLLSRTVGTNRVVDELYFNFRHTQEIPWMLPGVKPTDKPVEVIIVSVVCVRGSKLYHEHIYWDQASVLVQIGLIDSKLLPVRGAAAARKVLDEKSQPSNELIPDW